MNPRTRAGTITGVRKVEHVEHKKQIAVENKTYARALGASRWISRCVRGIPVQTECQIQKEAIFCASSEWLFLLFR